MGQKKGAVLKTAFETYAVEKMIGAGGSGEVYEVRDSDGVPHAVKVLDPSRASSARLKRFKNEISFCSRRVHRNIVQILASGVTADGSVFYVMPLYSGTLRELMTRKPAPERALHYFVQIFGWRGGCASERCLAQGLKAGEHTIFEREGRVGCS